jgi:hypothetical protein
MLKQILFKLLGVSDKNAEVREIKKDLDNKTMSIVRKNKKLQKIIMQEGVTLDIANATGLRHYELQ